MSSETDSNLFLDTKRPNATTGVSLADLATDSADKVSRLLEALVHTSGTTAIPNGALRSIRRDAAENALASAKLGIATSLYFALRSKHPPTASHCLRVALSCSAWCDTLDLSTEERDRIEVAALMHDLGKLGVPDRILRKPAQLTIEEKAVVSLAPLLGCDILRGCTGDHELLEMVRHATCWYGGRSEQKIAEDRIPLGARIIAIADAFDSMTADQVYRPAMSRESAVGNLFAGSGIQFDPELIRQFVKAVEKSPVWPPDHAQLSWLRTGALGSEHLPWKSAAESTPESDSDQPTTASSWNEADRPNSDTRAAVPNRSHGLRDPLLVPLLSSLTEAVIFVDSQGVIQDWNDSASQLTGIAGAAVMHHEWKPEIMSLLPENDGEETEVPIQCPVAETFNTSTGVTGRYRIARFDGTTVPVDLRSVPVTAKSQGVCGVLLILQDLSNQSRLESSVRKLKRQVIQDPLTGVANRAEMDRMLAELTSEEGRLFSLVICDIDHFKRVNDVYGHQAGDEALVRVAQILTAQSRQCDLVCRYGGEEFVVICPDCDLSAATKRAETIRAAVENAKLSMLNNTHITSSFGVTQVQTGDTAESVFSRADRALLQAKENGRNQVIQLGVGGRFEHITPLTQSKGWFSWFRFKAEERSALAATITTPVPSDIVIEKLRGFLADHRADVLDVAEGKLKIRLSVVQPACGRRTRPSKVVFLVDIKLSESLQQIAIGGTERMVTQQRTTIQVSLKADCNGARRDEDLTSCARNVIAGINCYLMGQIETE